MSENDEAQIGVDGVIEWRDAEGRLHRVGGPARVFPSGREEWFHHDRLPDLAAQGGIAASFMFWPVCAGVDRCHAAGEEVGVETPGVRTAPSLVRTVQALRAIRGRRPHGVGMRRLNPR